MYLQELEELAVAVEQDEELKQDYVDRAQKIEMCRFGIRRREKSR